MRQIKKNLFHIVVFIWLMILTIVNILMIIDIKSLVDYEVKTKHIDTYQEWRLSCLENNDASNQYCERAKQIKGYPFDIKIHEN